LFVVLDLLPLVVPGSRLFHHHIPYLMNPDPE
jgi:hypothetical protein